MTDISVLIFIFHLYAQRSNSFQRFCSGALAAVTGSSSDASIAAVSSACYVANTVQRFELGMSEVNIISNKSAKISLPVRYLKNTNSSFCTAKNHLRRYTNIYIVCTGVFCVNVYVYSYYLYIIGV